jgi:hypothetical protein
MALKPEIEIIRKKKKRERERPTRSKALSFLIIANTHTIKEQQREEDDK